MNDAREADLSWIFRLCREWGISEFSKNAQGEISVKFYPAAPIAQTKPTDEKKEKPRANLLDEAVKSVG